MNILRICLPVSKNKDARRREFLLNILLFFNIALLCVASIITVLRHMTIPPEKYDGLSPVITLSSLFFFIILFFISKKGHSKVSAYLFMISCTIPTAYMTYTWGVDLPQALLFFLLIITMSSVLINGLFSFVSSIIIAVFLFVIFYLNSAGRIIISSYWRRSEASIGDLILICITLFVAAVVSWLFNYETEKSLRRARASEKALKKEKAMLEIKVEERTEELKKAQIEKMTQLYRFAEFGRLSSGIFHDLINPMTVVSLNLERLKDMQQKEVTSARSHLSQAFAATKRMEEFIISLRKQLQKENTKSNFSLTEEIIQTIQMLSYRARKSNVEILFSPLTKDIKLFGDSIRFSQVVMNLISNAIDSYDNIAADDKKVEVELSEKGGAITFSVRDRGVGIKPENIGKIFDPFFTTKKGSSDKGMGIGLSSTKNIIEKDFSGTIEIDSEVNVGTIFKITIPTEK